MLFLNLSTAIALNSTPVVYNKTFKQYKRSRRIEYYVERPKPGYSGNSYKCKYNREKGVIVSKTCIFSKK